MAPAGLELTKGNLASATTSMATLCPLLPTLIKGPQVSLSPTASFLPNDHGALKRSTFQGLRHPDMEQALPHTLGHLQI